MAFSGGLTLTDLSDFLAPSQICIKPVSITESQPAPSAAPPPKEKPKTEIQFDKENVFEVGAGGGITVGGGGGEEKKKLKKAEITLNDCLACSGCITSAESVLVSLQSHEEVYNVLSTRPDLVPILSISPQSLASLSVSHSLPPLQVLTSLRAFFKSTLSFRLVFDTTFARSLSLYEGELEVLERSGRFGDKDDPEGENEKSKGKGKGKETTLSSSCPGWICYAEKTHGELLGLVSRTMSSQAVMGVLVKRSIVADYLEVSPEQIYHVSVMPCYDKKLEASRPDFASPSSTSSSSLESSDLDSPDSLRDTDCVLTTTEVSQMLDRAGWDLSAPITSSSSSHTSHNGLTLNEEEETLFPSLVPLPKQATTSGGYVWNALASILARLGPGELERARVEVIKRGADYDEILVKLVGEPELRVGLETEEGMDVDPSSPGPATPTTPSTTTMGTTIIYRAARCYGFRNLQNVVRKVQRDSQLLAPSRSAAGGVARRRLGLKKLPGGSSGVGGGAGTGEGEKFDFVEIMACPGGCVNGGGQEKRGKEGVKEVEEAMRLIGGTGVSEMEIQEEEGTKVGGTGQRWEGVHESVKPYLVEGRESEKKEVRKVWEKLRDMGKSLRTDYRAVKEEEWEGMGLAVKW